MKRYFITALAAFLLIGFSASSQENERAGADNPNKDSKRKSSKNSENKADKKGKLKEYDEIIIKRKNVDADKKVTIEIKDNEVIVDGKPLEEYVDEELSIQKRSMNRFKMNTPGSQFRFEGGDWQMEHDEAIGEERAFLGVMTEGSSNGAKVESVTPKSAAAEAGLKADDVITKINDKQVLDHEQLSNIIKDLKPGDEVKITYKRDGKEGTTTAKLGKRTMPGMIHRNFRGPDVAPPMVFNFDENGEFNNLFEMRNRPRLGIKAQDTEDGAGVKVLEVEEGSAAFKAGIKENDLITAFEGKPVKSASELAKASKEAKDKTSLKVQLKRDGKSQTIDVKIPKKLKTANL